MPKGMAGFVLAKGSLTSKGEKRKCRRKPLSTKQLWKISRKQSFRNRRD